MSTYSKTYEEEELQHEEGAMTFLDHLDELRTRLIRSVGFVLIAFIVCWIFSDKIYNFLQVPVQRALLNAQRVVARPLEDAPIKKLLEYPNGTIINHSLASDWKVGSVLIPAKNSVKLRVERDENGNVSLLLDEPWMINNQTIIDAGYRLPEALYADSLDNSGKKLITQTVQGAFNLYIKVAFYAAIFFAVPFLLIQVWGFISPGLYKHEKKYAFPFVLMSSLFFLIGCTFAYYIAFPRAADFLLEVAVEGNLEPLVSADEYFDLIILIMLGLGIVFEMPAVTFFMAKLGIVTPQFMLKGWRYAIVLIFIVAAVLSPTTDIPNLLVFAAPMLLLYGVSIGIAALFGRKRDPAELAES